ncbi:MAG TPA: MarR family transcriptional regulator [Terriglobales bacterium]|nr:MarR family transcriptional regulator [Terriglobales bacterium]
MSGIRKEIQQQRPFPTKPEEALVSLLRTVAVISAPIEDVLRKHDLTATQYNVLRILRGAGDSGWSCKEIGERLVQREPDITRLLGRLEKRGLISRKRDPGDRRSVRSRITARGLALLETLHPVLSQWAAQWFQRIQETDIQRLLGILDEIRASTPSVPVENDDG